MFLDVLEERTDLTTIITSQLPITEWYGYLNNPTVADAILDRLAYNSYKLKLSGESLRKLKSEKA